MPNEVDKENLIYTIKSAPDQLPAGIELSKDLILEKKFNTVVISGMGGSALVGELLQTYLNLKYPTSSERPDIKIVINRSYNLPPESYEPNCLNIISSYSGNTEETVSCFKEATNSNLFCLGIANGGKVSEMCEQHKLHFIELPKPNDAFQPRFATGYSFSALLNLIAKNGSIEINNNAFSQTAEKIKSEMDILENLGQEIAKKTNGKTPIIYAPIEFRGLAMIWKIMFNENAKTPAFWNYFPELSHNEMVGFTKPQGNFSFIMLKDKNSHPQNLRRADITAGLFKEYGMETIMVDIPDGDPLYRIFATLQIGSFASYHLALIYGVDPTPVEMVEKLKKLLG